MAPWHAHSVPLFKKAEFHKGVATKNALWLTVCISIIIILPTVISEKGNKFCYEYFLSDCPYCCCCNIQKSVLTQLSRSFQQDSFFVLAILDAIHRYKSYSNTKTKYTSQQIVHIKFSTSIYWKNVWYINKVLRQKSQAS